MQKIADKILPIAKCSLVLDLNLVVSLLIVSDVFNNIKEYTAAAAVFIQSELDILLDCYGSCYDLIPNPISDIIDTRTCDATLWEA